MAIISRNEKAYCRLSPVSKHLVQGIVIVCNMKIEVVVRWKVSPTIWASIGVELLVVGIIVCV
jgi:hypothetical protein